METCTISEIIAIIYKKWIEKIGMSTGKTSEGITPQLALTQLIQYEEKQAQLRV